MGRCAVLSRSLLFPFLFGSWTWCEIKRLSTLCSRAGDSAGWVSRPPVSARTWGKSRDGREGCPRPEQMCSADPGRPLAAACPSPACWSAGQGGIARRRHFPQGLLSQPCVFLRSGSLPQRMATWPENLPCSWSRSPPVSFLHQHLPPSETTICAHFCLCLQKYKPMKGGASPALFRTAPLGLGSRGPRGGLLTDAVGTRTSGAQSAHAATRTCVCV